MQNNHKKDRSRGPVGGPMGGPGHMMGEKAKNFKGTISKLIKHIAKYKIATILVIVLSIISAVLSIVGPKQMGNIVDSIANGFMSSIKGGPGIDFNNVARMLLGLLALYAFSSVFGIMQGYVMAGVSQKLSYKFRKDLSRKIHRLPMSYFDSVTHGEVLSRITNDIDTLTQSLNQSLSQVISSITIAIGVLIMMFSISWLMTLAALLIVPMSAFLMQIVVKKSQKHFVSQQKYLGHVNGQVEEVYSGQVIVKAFNGEKKALEDFEKYNDELYSSAWKSQFLSGLMHPIMSFIGNLGYVMVAILGGSLAIKGSITIGNIQSFIQYVRMFNQPLSQIAQVTSMLQSTAAAAERVFEFLELEEEEQTITNSTSATNLIGQVTFDHVKFGYQADKTIINDFSTVIKPGQKVAIVGPTGAGKTTMVKLLMRFYDVTGGRILIDGHDIRSFDRNELRSMFGMVLQDTWLFGGSIADNIRYGKLDATQEEVEAAARSAHVHHFVQTLPEGYNMVINEEASNISQGQKQLLTIARAILADPKVLILDEATSSVDTRTELRIQKAMDNLMHGRTSFVIAHRLSTIRDADLILVMRDGDIVEQGKHEELLEKNGFYAQLYNAQFQQVLSA